jgi:hypothetical protein
MTEPEPPRMFIVTSAAVVIEVVLSPQMDAAMDILGDAGMLDEKRAKLLHLCEQKGDNPEHLARKLVTLSKAAFPR